MTRDEDMAFGKLDDETLQKIREISILKVADEQFGQPLHGEQPAGAACQC